MTFFKHEQALMESTSGGNVETIREMVFRNYDVQAAENLFLESKEIEE
jgi:hypothetical protein